MQIRKITSNFANRKNKFNHGHLFTMKDEKMKIVPDFGHIDFAEGRPEGLPQPKVVKCGTKNRNHAPIKVKRAIRTGVRIYQSGESIDWAEAYN